MSKDGKNYTSRPTPKEIPMNNQGTKPSAESGMVDNRRNDNASNFDKSGSSSGKPKSAPVDTDD